MKSLGYPGGKYNQALYKTIINEIPPHESYIELFAGTAGILKHKKPALSNTIVEIDRSIIVKANYPCSTVIVNDCVFRSKQLITTARSNTFIYADPPYVLSSRRSRAVIYNYEISDQQHVDLAQLFSTTLAKVAISGYNSPLYDELYKTWRKIEIPVRTRKGPALECVWFNYETPFILAETTFAGKNKAERQQIKRKCKRLIHRISLMPAYERQFVLTALQQL